MTDQPAITRRAAEAIVGQAESDHRSDWHYKDKARRERCRLLSYECPFIHWAVSDD